MPEKSPASKLDYSQNKSVPIREELIYLLSCASEYEHKMACIYLFTAYSLKNDGSEGGLTDAQADMVRNWRRQLAAIGVDRMRHLAQISNLLTAIGGTPYFARPTFPLSASTNPSESSITLEPFSQSMLDHLITYEHPDTIIKVPEQQQEAQRTWTPARDGKNELAEPLTTNLTTIGVLYARINKGLHSTPTDKLFINPPDAQAHPAYLTLSDQLIAVTDPASAYNALTHIIGADPATPAKDTAPHSDILHTFRNALVRMVGADPATPAKDTAPHSDILHTIRTEYVAAVADARQKSTSFEPVRLVGKNPSVHLEEDTPGSTHIVDQLTVTVANLFNASYDTMLSMLLRFFVYTEESEADLKRLAKAIRRLMTSVIRPLSEALTKMPMNSASHPGVCAGPPFGDSGDVPKLLHQASTKTLFDEQLWNLASEATKLCVTSGLLPEIQEATAALQDLACQFADTDGPHGMSARVATLKQMQAELDCTIQSSVNGPYLLTNVENLVNWLGEDIPALPQMALCRCGKSATKPFCDGTHARVDFTSQKDPKRVPNRRDTYVGTAITILDNRGTCAHSGFCSDRLSSVFHAGEDPFVVPNGARMDDIIRAVRSCPSGALSYALGAAEARTSVDQVRPPTIEVSKDGPYRITGSIMLKDGRGNDEPRNEGASLEHYSLCRCGHSQNKPFCSGMHWYVDFHDPKPVEDHEPTLFEWAGGLPVFTRMTRLFYDKYVPQDPLLQPLFAHMSPDHPERVATWLSEVFGGPNCYTDTYGDYTHMLSQHLGRSLTEEQRGRWVSLLFQAANDVGLAADPEFRSAFTSYIEWGSRLAVENSATDAHPPQHMPLPHWNWGTAGAPGSRVSGTPSLPVEEEAITLPTKDEPIDFSKHIKPLFRVMDRQSMKWAFDLWSNEDVVKHADGILQRLKNGTMPCDAPWPQEKIDVFQRWVEFSH